MSVSANGWKIGFDGGMISREAVVKIVENKFASTTNIVLRKILKDLEVYCHDVEVVKRASLWKLPQTWRHPKLPAEEMSEKCTLQIMPGTEISRCTRPGINRGEISTFKMYSGFRL